MKLNQAHQALHRKQIALRIDTHLYHANLAENDSIPAAWRFQQGSKFRAFFCLRSIEITE